MLNAAKIDFVSERVSDEKTLTTIRKVYKWQTPESKSYVLDPHSAIDVTTALRSIKTAPGVHHVALATAHSAKFSNTVETALKEEKDFHFDDILPQQFVKLKDQPKRVIYVKKSKRLEGIKRIIINKVKKKLNKTNS